MAAPASSEARVPTAIPRRYLAQLCKHFQHRLPVFLDETAGCIAFSGGTCALRADSDSLVMRIDAADEPALAQLEDVVARHLLRFAFREPPNVRWVRVA